MKAQPRDHGGGLDAAIAEFGGNRSDWLDLSTGINPTGYPVTGFSDTDWGALPDSGAMADILKAARAFWQVPDNAVIIAASGASVLIAQIPFLRPAGRVQIEARTYNEHAHAFLNAGWQVGHAPTSARVVVHPNNPDGRFWDEEDVPGGQDRLLVIDESFCDIAPGASLIRRASEPGTVILKSFGKFWGLAGARLGFAIGQPDMMAELAVRLGPWPVSGPVLKLGAKALRDSDWADATRARLETDAKRLDDLLSKHGIRAIGGTTLFRLYETPDARAFQRGLVRNRVLSRIFPYSRSWVRLGLPGIESSWQQLTDALKAME